MRVLFMGTPDIATGCLQKLIDEKYDIIGVVTQPDKPQNRGKKLGMPPVKELALKYDIPVYQPIKARDEEFVATLKELNPDIIVVVAFGQILPKSILDIPKFGCINVHVSLLPKYRGAAPINWVIINGEEKTGVTTMYMDEGLDTGDMILTEEFDLDDEITAGELHDKMKDRGADVTCQYLILTTYPMREIMRSVRIQPSVPMQERQLRNSRSFFWITSADSGSIIPADIFPILRSRLHLSLRKRTVFFRQTS